MRPPKQKQPQVKKGRCRVLEYVCSVVSLIVSLALKSPYGERSIKYVLHGVYVYSVD